MKFQTVVADFFTNQPLFIKVLFAFYKAFIFQKIIEYVNIQDCIHVIRRWVVIVIN